MSEEDDSYGFEDEEKSKILKYYNENKENIIKEVDDENKTTIIKEAKIFEEEEDEKEEINTSLEMKEEKGKIINEEISINSEKNNINYESEIISTSKKQSEIFSNNENKSLLSPSKIDINPNKTESDFKEELNNSKNNDLNDKYHNLFLPQSVISTKINRNKRLSLNNSVNLSEKNLNSDFNTPLKLNKKTHFFSRSSSKEKINTKKINSNLPRISSAKNLKKSNSKLFLMKSENENDNNKEHGYVNKRKKITGIPFNTKTKLYLSNNKTSNKLLEIVKKKKKEEEIDNELLNMEKENLNLIRELEKLNIQLNTLINKQTPIAILNYNKTHPKNKSVQPSTPEILKQSEIIMQKKYLTNLITEYNKLYSKFNIENDSNVKEELIDEIEKKKIEYKKCLNENKKLKDKIYVNENYLKKCHIQQKNIITNYEDYESKIKLYKKKISTIKNDIERKENLYKNESKIILDLNKKYLKFKEILDNYEESPSSLNKKNKLKKNNKKDEEEFNKLIKKKNSLIHLRNTKKNNYNQEIKKQVKYIEQLKNTINEVNQTLTSME